MLITNDANNKDIIAISQKILNNEETNAVNNKEEKSKNDEKKDSVIISEEAIQLFRQQALESSEDKSYMDYAKILEIARRIASGDKVPASDEKKLLEYDRDLYLSAKSTAMMNANKKHKKHDALFEDEENSEIDEKLRALDNEYAAPVSSDAVSSEAAEVSDSSPSE